MIVDEPLSYARQLNLTAVADRDNCPDVEVFAHGVRRSIDELARSGPVSATDDDAVGQRSPAQSVGEAAVGGGG